MFRQDVKYPAYRKAKKRRKIRADIKVIWLVAILITIAVFLITIAAASGAAQPKETERPAVEAPALLAVSTTDEKVNAVVNTVEQTETEPVTEDVAEPEPELVCIGTYRLTAYCSCEKCCGYWATVRPLDSEGNPIVYTASGAVAKAGVTVAADTSVLPFGTVVVINGHEYIVQDRGGAIKGEKIDIYFDDHQEALKFGVQYAEVYVKGGN